jgi:hypothetical protein
MSDLIRAAGIAVLLSLPACSDYATFVTGTSIGITANANTEQVQIGYARAELFQGPAYPDVGDVPAAVGFLGSDLAPFSPHVRQLYATGDAARIVTMHNDPLECPADGSLVVNGQPTNCAEKTEALSGERRALVFGTGASVGLNLGFTGNVPSSIKFGYDREELSIIPLHTQAPAADAKATDKYSSTLASIDTNVTTSNLLSSDLHLTQFFATGAAARNLAKRSDIRNYFSDTAAAAVVSSYKPDKSSKCISDWLGNGTDAAKTAQLNNAVASIKGIDSGTFISDEKYSAQRARFVKNNSIPCP